MFRTLHHHKFLHFTVHSSRQLKCTRLTRCITGSRFMHHEHPPTYDGKDGTRTIQTYTSKSYEEENNKFKFKKQLSTIVGLLGTAVLLSGGSVLSEAEDKDSPDPDSADTFSEGSGDHSGPVGKDEGRTKKYAKKIKLIFTDTKNPGVKTVQKLHVTSFKDQDQTRSHSNASTSLDVCEAERLARKLLKQRMQEVGAPGMVVAVTVNGKTVWTEGFGYADLENNVRCKPDTVMRVASISKSITMTALAQLWEAGKLDLDAPIQTYIPSFPHKIYEGEQVAITTRQLISHKAGIRHYELKDPSKNKQEDTKSTEKNKEDDKEKAKGKEKQEANRSPHKIKESTKSTEEIKEGDTKAEKDNLTSERIAERRKEINNIINQKANQRRKNMRKKEEDKNYEFDMEEYFIKEEFDTVKEALELFENDELFFKPGSGFLYTTHGFTLVSAVVEAAAGKPFTEVARRLFRELGLDNTYLDQHDPIIYNRARYYVRNKYGKLLNAPYVDNSYKWAGGGFLSTVGDLCKFANAMLYASQYAGDSGLPGYLKASTVKELWQQVEGTDKNWRQDGGYGMGWEVCDGNAKKGFCRTPKHFAGHSGAAVGASSILLILQEKDNEGNTSSSQTQDEKEVKVIGAKNNDGKKNENCESSCQKSPEVPRGVVVALITNMQGVGLRKAAMEIGELFQKAYVR